jgi:hypothetical protein
MELTRYDRDTQIISSRVRPFVSGKGNLTVYTDHSICEARRRTPVQCFLMVKGRNPFTFPLLPSESLPFIPFRFLIIDHIAIHRIMYSVFIMQRREDIWGPDGVHAVNCQSR